MGKFFLTAFISFVLLGDALAATGEGWHIVDYVDPSTYEKVKAATVENDDGYTVYVFRNDQKPVSWVFTLPSKSLDKLDNKVAAFYKLDNGPVSAIETSSTLADHTVIGTQWVKELIWHGEGRPTFGTMRKILDGSSLDLKFNVVDGKPLTTEFSLNGANEVISTVIGIPIDIDKEAAKKDYELSQVISDAFFVCMDIEKALKDTSYIDKCSIVAKKCTYFINRSVDYIRDCMRNNGYPISSK